MFYKNTQFFISSLTHELTFSIEWKHIHTFIIIIIISPP